jgi:putative FmdB family regulatory protein
MPIYEYECLNCGKQCEVIQKFDDEPLSSCPECGGHMHKLVSQSSFVLKGTGWYATDYARAEQKKSEKPAGKSHTKPEQPKSKVSAKNS